MEKHLCISPKLGHLVQLFSIKEDSGERNSINEREYQDCCRPNTELTVRKYCCWNVMTFSKNILAVLFILSTINLCLGKPRWIFLNDKKNRAEENDDETLSYGKNDENLANEWKKRNIIEIKQKRCNEPNCMKWPEHEKKEQ